MKNDNYELYRTLTSYHRDHCKLYADYIDSQFLDKTNTIADIPYLPVRLFKEFDLISVKEDEVFKIMYSSGTTGKASKIHLDKETAKNQSLHLAKSFKEYFGDSRFPMLIIDSESTARGMTARTAAVNGFSIYGKKRCFALNEKMELRVEEVLKFIEEYKGSRIFIFGFTFILYQYFIKKLQSLDLMLDLSNAFILHGGGWKKLANLNITDLEFKSLLKSTVKCESVHNYYGMIEQTGSIYFECEYGNLHAPTNGDVIIRNFKTLEPNEYGQEGIIQVLSTIQKSYPGHSLLTEDVGLTYPANDCRCGRDGDIIKIHGRLESAEIRGCSDAV
ncbi:acyl-protein synthetase [Salinispirillum marinum]|uniref:Acyl-protein synthetase n=2 Tax=Saccharospirillaceae TaxID=255527 RepID=A0ABV8BFJ8_9GAMM